MALRNYFQDLVRAQNRCNGTSCEEEQSIKITIINDNSSSSLPDEYGDDCTNHDALFSSNRTMTITGTDSGLSMSDDNSDSFIGCHHSFHRDESDFEANRVMLADFRRRQRILRETLSPKLNTSSMSSIEHFSPERYNWQTDLPSANCHFHNNSEEGITGEDSQRGRLARLKRSLLREQKESGCLLL
mmetsp:Transcript_9826/g.23740  ORF Transcript_9826/g.23740 Transcript_9826/m.23740 type:complete len:187 (-) Transcript_9826:1259-1819(-)